MRGFYVVKNPLGKPSLSINEGFSTIEGSTIEGFQCINIFGIFNKIHEIIGFHLQFIPDCFHSLMEHLFSSHTNTFQEGMKLITIKLWLVSFLLGTLRFVKRVNIPRQNETNLLFSSLLKSCVLTLVSFPLETREKSLSIRVRHMIKSCHITSKTT